MTDTTTYPVTYKYSCILLVLSGVVLWSAPSWAGKEDVAKSHYTIGQSYYEQGSYVEAIREFEKAYELVGRPALLYNIGQSYERLGKLAEAVENYEKYMTTAKVTDETLRQKIANLKKRLQQTGIRVVSNVDGATVMVDGQQMGQTPLRDPIALSPGQHQISVTKDGFTEFALAVSVSAGSVVDVQAQLTATATGVAPQMPAQPTTSPELTTPTTVTAAPASSAARPARKRFWTWIALAGAGTAGTIAGVTGGMALSKASSAETADDAKAKNAKTLALVSDMMLGVAAATAITAVILFFTEGSSEQQPATATRIVPLLQSQFAGVGLTKTY